ncbi:MAG: VOC family protein [bacterium]
MSEAMYLHDPDGNGLELYADRPRDQWQWRGGQIAMTTEPLNIQSLMSELLGDPEKWTGIAPGADVGHVHLHVANLERAEAFYGGAVGLEVTQRDYPGALFMSAGGYHHHIGVNIWARAGAPPPPPDAVGLLAFALVIPEEGTWRAIQARLKEAGFALEGRREYGFAQNVLVHDPDRIGVELLLPTD